MLVKTLSAGDPKERTLGFVTSFFGEGVFHALFENERPTKITCGANLTFRPARK
jgi:hypothetical protein